MRLRSVQRSVQRGPVHGLFGRETFPGGAILHWDADIDAFSEQTGGPHTFNHAVLSPQYQRNADGSYANVGAKPAVDVFSGKRWLRSCGAVTNLLPSGAENFAGASWTRRGTTAAQNADGSYRITLGASGVKDIYSSLATTKVPYVLSIDAKLVSGTAMLRLKDAARGTVYSDFSLSAEWKRIDLVVTALGGQAHHLHSSDGSDLTVDIRLPLAANVAYPVPYTPPGTTMPASNATTTNGSWFTLPDGSELWKALDGGPDTDGVELVTNGGFDVDTSGWTTGVATTSLSWSDGQVVATRIGSPSDNAAVIMTGCVTATGGYYKISFDAYSPTANTVLNVGFSNDASVIGASYATTPVITNVKTTYTLKIVSNGYSRFAINARVEFVTGSAIYLDNISIQRIQPQPLTLATRVRMGVGSGDLAVGLWQVASVTAVQEAVQHFRYRVIEGFEAVRGHDGVLPAFAPSATTAARNAIIRRITQVNTAGTQFRVGYMIEGTHTTIQWGPWVAFDGSFNPSTLYRLMLGYNTPYPMWFNKVTAWKKQVTDAEILEAMA